jgi:CBS domain-containing protein
MPILDLAREDVVTAPPETSVEELAATMRDEEVGSIVITNGSTATGIVTDRDLTTRVLAEGAGPDDHTASDVMSSNLCEIGPDAGFYQAAEAMSENGVRRLPVCDDSGDLHGIITADDLTELIADESQQLAAVIQAQRPPY